MIRSLAGSIWNSNRSVCLWFPWGNRFYWHSSVLFFPLLFAFQEDEIFSAPQAGMGQSRLRLWVAKWGSVRLKFAREFRSFVVCSENGVLFSLSKVFCCCWIYRNRKKHLINKTSYVIEILFKNTIIFATLMVNKNNLKLAIDNIVFKKFQTCWRNHY